MMFRMSPGMTMTLTVLLCHFLAAFSALGMALFMPRILLSIDASAPEYWVGIFFTIPTICTAITVVYWGRFADHFGKRISLLRAQLGLCIGFLISGFADSIGLFALGLAIQGLCGGTMAASNAYLATTQRRERLAQSLNLTQLSARLALISGPIVLGLFTQLKEPLEIYRVLALLPMLAFLITLMLPADTVASQQRSLNDVKNNKPSLSLLIVLQFLFCFSMVVTYPYFLLFVQTLGTARDSFAGFIYSLPHIVYIALVFVIPKIIYSSVVKAVMGFLLLSVSYWLHFYLDNLSLLVMARLIFGLGILLSYDGLHRMLADILRKEKAGVIFSSIDASGKWGGVVAGLIAGVIVSYADYRAPFVLALGSSLLGLFMLIIIYINSTYMSRFSCKLSKG